MKARSIPVRPQIAFWGICSIALIWIAATILFEFHLGLPVTGVQWLKRMAGWGLEGLLIRTLLLGVRRYYTLRSTQ